MRLSEVDLNLLVAFEALMIERNVTRAGRRVGLAQPSMSNALSRLRGPFNDRLFVRSAQRMVPTERAGRLAQPIGRALDEIRGVLGDAQGFDPAVSSGIVWLAAADDVRPHLAPVLAQQLATAAPGVTLHVEPLELERVFAQLDDGRVDIAIGSFAAVPSRFATHLLGKERPVCLVRRDHPVVNGSFAREVFESIGHVAAPLGCGRVDFDSALGESGSQRRVVLKVADPLAVPFIVGGSDLIGVVPDRLAMRLAEATDCTVHPLPVDRPDCAIWMIWTHASDAVPLLGWIREQTAEAWTV